MTACFDFSSSSSRVSLIVIVIAMVWQGLSLGAIVSRKVKRTLGEVVPGSPSRAKPKVGQISRRYACAESRSTAPNLPPSRLTYKHRAVLPSFCAYVEEYVAGPTIHRSRSCHPKDRPRVSNHGKSRILGTPAHRNGRGMVVERQRLCVFGKA